MLRRGDTDSYVMDGSWRGYRQVTLLSWAFSPLLKLFSDTIFHVRHYKIFLKVAPLLPDRSLITSLFSRMMNINFSFVFAVPCVFYLGHITHKPSPLFHQRVTQSLFDGEVFYIYCCCEFQRWAESRRFFSRSPTKEPSGRSPFFLSLKINLI